MTFQEDYKKLIEFSLAQIRKKKLRLDPADLVNDAFLEYNESNIEYNISNIKKIIINFLYKEFKHKTSTVPEWHKERKITNGHCKKCGDIKPISGFYQQMVNSALAPIAYCKDCYLQKQKENYNSNKAIWLERSSIWKSKNKERIKQKKKEYYLKNRILKPRIPKPKKIKEKKVKEKKVKQIILKPKRIKQTDEERRLKWNAYVKERSRKFGTKPWSEFIEEKKKNAKPIHELWRNANKKYSQKQKENLTDVYIKSLLTRKAKNPTKEMIDAKRQEILNLRKCAIAQ